MLGKRSAAKNYHPVSLLSVVSKVFEKLVNNKIVDHLEKSGFFADFQYGFRSSWSTAGLLTVVSDRIARTLNRSWAYLLKQGVTWDHLKLAETTWNHPETTWNHLKLPETSHIKVLFIQNKYSQVAFALVVPPKKIFGQFWSQKLKFSKLTEIWCRHTCYMERWPSG